MGQPLFVCSNLYLQQLANCRGSDISSDLFLFPFLFFSRLLCANARKNRRPQVDVNGIIRNLAFTAALTEQTDAARVNEAKMDALAQFVCGLIGWRGEHSHATV